MSLWLLSVYIIFFTILAVKNYRVSLGLFIVLLPAYLLRFSLGPLPTTLLEINFLILFFVWLFKYAKTDLPDILTWFKNNKLVSLTIGLFILSATISVFVGNHTYADPMSALLRGLGIWRAYFIEPVGLFYFP